MDSYPGVMSTNSPMSTVSRPLITGRGVGHKTEITPLQPLFQKIGSSWSQTTGTPRSLQTGTGSRPQTSGSGFRPQPGSSGFRSKANSSSQQALNKNGIIQPGHIQSPGSSSGFFEPGNGHLSGVLGSLGSTQKLTSCESSLIASNAELLCDVLPVAPLGKHTHKLQKLQSTDKSQMKCWPGLHEALSAAAPPKDDLSLPCWPGLAEAFEATHLMNDQSPQNDYHQTLQDDCDQSLENAFLNSTINGKAEPRILQSEDMLQEENSTTIKKLLRHLRNPLPPMKTWLKREISKVSIANTRSTATLKSMGSAKTLSQSENAAASMKSSPSSKKQVYTDEEAHQAVFIQNQFSAGNTVLRGELQDFADEMAMKKVEEANNKWNIERRWRQADRQKMRYNREMKRGREKQLLREEQHKQELQQQHVKAAAMQKREETAENSPKSEAALKKQQQDKLTPIAQGFMKILKPQQSLQTRMKMLNRLAAGRKESGVNFKVPGKLAPVPEGGRGSTGTVARQTWRMIQSAVNKNDNDESSEPPIDTLVTPENMKTLRETFHRYDIDKSGGLETNEIRPAVQDVGICPKVREEKRAVNHIVREVVEGCGGMGLDFEEFVMLVHRLRTKIADVQRTELETAYSMSCDEKGTFNPVNICQILEKVSHVKLRTQDMIEILKEFEDFQPGRTWLNPEQMEIVKKKEHEEAERKKMMWNAEEVVHDDEDPIMKDFDAFEECLTRAREKLAAIRREQERQIGQDHKIPQETFTSFRSELIELDELFRKYDQDESGLLDEGEVRQVLTDFGCMPKTFLEQKALQLMFWDIKYPNRDPPEKIDLSNAEFDFMEFLTLIRRLRKMNSDTLKATMLADFNRYDRDKSGELDMQEVAKILHEMNLIPRSKEEQSEILAIFEEVDEDGSQTFDFKEFQILIIRVRERLEKIANERAQAHALSIGITLKRFKEVMPLFRASDEEGLGMIWVPQLRIAMDRLGKVISSERLHVLFEDFADEKHGQKYLGIDQFCNMMKQIDDGVIAIPDHKRRIKKDEAAEKKKKKKKTSQPGEDADVTAGSDGGSNASSRASSPHEKP
eukprot:gnl/MRDRNA2_/MRDRNA2_96682_c0_seq1.p1 gnl/MRDRNA2_/MRDRNA2_96682_c0~~gnl/MRDRNA2_/MRDRNA2_96682_c0_seq1.p1  ORF type:complete len:1075 (+),score=251.98 gnl/MRDRNA2_/MRDRNA2_96682_c0_seq1:142-3366(+)